MNKHREQPELNIKKASPADTESEAQKKIFVTSERPMHGHECVAAMRFLPPDVELHWHDFFEIELVISGHGVQVLNGREYEVHRGAMYFINPTDVHSYHAIEPMQIYHVSFDEKFLYDRKFAEFFGYQSVRIYNLNEQMTQEMEKLFSLFINEYGNTHPYREELMRNYFDCLLVYFFRISGSERSDSKLDGDYSVIAEVMVYLRLHFKESPTLAEAAHVAGLSPNYFSTRFREVTGQKYIDFLNGIKLDYAYGLVSQSSLSISEICYACGFSTMSNFLKLFGRRFGKTPTEIRK